MGNLRKPEAVRMMTKAAGKRKRRLGSDVEAVRASRLAAYGVWVDEGRASGLILPKPDQPYRSHLRIAQGATDRRRRVRERRQQDRHPSPGRDQADDEPTRLAGLSGRAEAGLSGQSDLVVNPVQP